MFFSLLFWRLSKYARQYGDNGRLGTKVNICLEEFSNIGHLSDFLRIISVIRSRNVACQIVIQSMAQLSDRYPGTQWEEIISNIDWQLFLGCNDIMTAEYISKQCSTVTVRTTSGSRPQTPLFSPINSSTRPYTETSSSVKRPLMMPDELLRMDRNKSILLVGGQKPLELYKITPEEIPGFERLKPVRVTDHIPAWRETEAERERAGLNEQTARKFAGPETDESPDKPTPRKNILPFRPPQRQTVSQTDNPKPQQAEQTELGQTPDNLPSAAKARPQYKGGGAEDVEPKHQVHKDAEMTWLKVNQHAKG
jgi:type IV secretion system protein VirD4